MRRLWTILVLLGALTAVAGAEPNIRRFEGSPFSGTNLTVEQARSLGTGTYRFSLLGDYEKKSVIFIRDGQPEDILGQRLLVDALVSYGITDWLDAGLVLPMAFAQTGRLVQDDQSIATVALGDPQLALRLRIADLLEETINLSAVAATWIPTQQQDTYLSEDGAGGQAKLVATYHITRATNAGLSVGYFARPTTMFAGLKMDDELRFALAANHRMLGRRLQVGTEAKFGTDASRPFSQKQLNAGDLNIGVKLNSPRGHGLLLGTGIGLLSGIGTPAWRVFAGYGFTGRTSAPRARLRQDGQIAQRQSGGETRMGTMLPTQTAVTSARTIDFDGDGLLGAEDRCPIHPEDKDFFEDEDGCPDLDNDLDGIPDHKDVAPIWAEDWDGYQDLDGVADADNDGDGIDDTTDKCPNASGAGDGCPNSPISWLSRLKTKHEYDHSAAPVMMGPYIIPMAPIVFETKTQKLSAASEKTLDALARFIKLNPRLLRLEVAVHRNTKASRAIDQWISTLQAARVKEALVERGVDRVRLYPIGYGQTRRSNTLALNRFDDSQIELRWLQEGDVLPTLGSLEPPAEVANSKEARQIIHIKPVIVSKKTRLFTELKLRFKPRKSTLTSQSLKSLQLLSAKFQALQHKHIEIGVHTDGLGAKAKKKALSEARAKEIKRILVTMGLSPDLVVARGYGASRPVASDETAAGRARNRRVEFLVSEDKPSATNKEAR